MLTITFNIHYPTQWGERIVVTGNIPELGSNHLQSALNLHYQKGNNWQGSIQIEDTTDFDYQYVLLNEASHELNREWGEHRSFRLGKADKKRENICLKDVWRAKYHPENALYNAAFLKVIFNPKKYKASKAKRSKNQPALRFQLFAPRVGKHQQLCVLGNLPALGSWGARKPLLFSSEDYPLWSGTVSFIGGMNIEYKYGIYDIEEKEVVFLENGENRVLPYTETKGNDLTIVHDNYFQHPQGDWKGAGVAIPVFSLRSQNSMGIGEFTDIRLLVDWAAQIGMKMVQILPINDTSATTTFVDSYPYAAISVFALHPMYLNIEALEGFEKTVDYQAYQSLQLELNALEVVDYVTVNKHKLQLARQIFEVTKTNFLKSKPFKKFFESSQYWLKPYAYFCTLRDQHQTVDFNQWGTDKRFSTERMEAACSENSEQFNDIAFYYFLQFYLDQQLQEVSDYARKHQIVLKGDIPIGIYRYSVDAWTQPHLYHMDMQAGAPPDSFSDVGQNWGFPTYNWRVMAQDGYAWWQDRLKILSKYFDAFRIDHILGFFRIWQVPYESVHATLGYFYPAIPITVNEFYERGIPFSFDRLCKPFITGGYLQELFGDQSDYVKETFLQPLYDSRFAFKPAFDTQRKIENYFKQTGRKKATPLEEELLKLHGEVLFLEEKDSNGQAFHPRFDLHKTRSLQHFPHHVQESIAALYHDYFYKRQEAFWTKSALTKLPSIKAATDMLICGEDLGMIPACVPQVMKDMDMLTLEIQRMAKNPTTEFLQVEDTPYHSVSSPSTHDMSPIRLWWAESEREYIQRFYRHELKQMDYASDTCTPEIARQIIQQHLDLPSMWTVFPVSDLLGMSPTLSHPNPSAERINEPDQIPHYWQYRMHIGLEELMEDADFVQQLKTMMKESNRL